MIDVPGGVASFSDSDTAQLPFVPTILNPEFRQGLGFDSKGQPVQVSAFYDAPAFAVRASRKFTGTIEYTPYKTTARILTYSPLTEVSTFGFRTIFGFVSAYYQGRLVTHQVAPPTLENGNADIELYRIYSYSVTNGDGENEMPPNYPADGNYPGKTFKFDVSPSMRTERVHEIGYIDRPLGRAWAHSIGVPVLEPYVGDHGYKPKKLIRLATLDPKVYPSDIIAKAFDFIKSKNLGNVNA